MSLHPAVLMKYCIIYCCNLSHSDARVHEIDQQLYQFALQHCLSGRTGSALA